MKWSQLQQITGENPLFHTSLLVSDEHTPYQIQRRLVDWVQAEKIVKLKRGFYVLKKIPAHRTPHPFVIANQMVKGSYISLQMALSYYSLIPEHVAVVTSVTTQRPGEWQNEYGRFTYRHIQPKLFYGITYRAVTDTQSAFIATPEKALLDLIYLRSDGDNPNYIASLRLQNLELLNLESLECLAQQSGKPKLQRAVAHIIKEAVQQEMEYEAL